MWDAESGQAACQCLYSFRGRACELECPLSENGVMCSDHGMCDGNATCRCAMDWKGELCDEPAAMETSSGLGRHSCFGIVTISVTWSALHLMASWVT